MGNKALIAVCLAAALWSAPTAAEEIRAEMVGRDAPLKGLAHTTRERLAAAVGAMRPRGATVRLEVRDVHDVVIVVTGGRRT